MIELPEALNLARQMNMTLSGKRIASAMRGNSPHKFTFYNRPPDEYDTILTGKTVSAAREHGGCIRISVEPDAMLVLGGGGERIFLHPDERTLPKKHQFLLGFEDDTFLSVTVQMWGSAQLFLAQEIAERPDFNKRGVSPMDDDFTWEFVRSLFDAVPSDDPRSIKFFVISKPGIWGVGNGYTQDILFRAKLHPRRKVVTLSDDEKRRFYDAVRSTIQDASRLNGRDTELDLFGKPGRYVRLMDNRTVGTPCAECGTTIEKMSYLGGASYYCPQCQV